MVDVFCLKRESTGSETCISVLRPHPAVTVLKLQLLYVLTKRGMERNQQILKTPKSAQLGSMQAQDRIPPRIRWLLSTDRQGSTQVCTARSELSLLDKVFVQIACHTALDAEIEG